MTTETTTRTETLRRLAMAATPGPWHVGKVRSYGIFPAVDPDEDGALAAVRHWEPGLEPKSDQDAANAAYIAAVDPQTVLALLDVVDAAYERDLSGFPELRAALDRLAALDTPGGQE